MIGSACSRLWCHPTLLAAFSSCGFMKSRHHVDHSDQPELGLLCASCWIHTNSTWTCDIGSNRPNLCDSLNSSKTEFLPIGLSKQLAKINNSSLNTTHSARNLGFIFDEHLTFSGHISTVSNSCLTLRSPGSNRSRTLLHVLLSKLPNPVTSLSSFGLCSG